MGVVLGVRQAYDDHFRTRLVEISLTGSLGRIVAIALALSIVIGSWLLFEYSETSRQRQAAEQPQGGPDASGTRAVDPSPSSAGTRRDPDPSSPDRLDDLLVP
jgi:branched-subunit amino acid ABC-type transport system permease component